MLAPWSIEWHETLPSTMIRARELAESGAEGGTVVVADYQSEGRGTRGRLWLAPPGSCLMFTIISRSATGSDQLQVLPRRISEAITRALREDFGLACSVKEPNDILVSGRKLCGVLCTSHIVGTRIEWVLCGVGLNTHMSPDQLPIQAATSLVIEGVDPPAHPRLLEQLLARLDVLR